MIFQLLYFDLVLFLFRKSGLYILGGKKGCRTNAELWCCLVLRKFNIIAETIFMSLYHFCAFFLSSGPKVPTATSWFQRTSRHTLVRFFLLDPATFFWLNFEVQLPRHLPVHLSVFQVLFVNVFLFVR